MNVLIVIRLSYEARNVLSYTRHMVQNFKTFRESYQPIKTLASIYDAQTRKEEKETQSAAAPL